MTGRATISVGVGINCPRGRLMTVSSLLCVDRFNRKEFVSVLDLLFTDKDVLFNKRIFIIPFACGILIKSSFQKSTWQHF